MIGSKEAVNPADITSYYRTGDPRSGGGWGGGGVPCAKEEACIRRLCSTVVYDQLLTTFFLQPFVSRSVRFDLRARASFISSLRSLFRLSTSFFHEALLQDTANARIYIRCAPITLPDKLANPFVLFFSRFPFLPRGSSPSPSVKSRDNTLKNPLLLHFDSGSGFFLPYFVSFVFYIRYFALVKARRR